MSHFLPEIASCIFISLVLYFLFQKIMTVTQKTDDPKPLTHCPNCGQQLQYRNGTVLPHKYMAAGVHPTVCLFGRPKEGAKA